MIILKHVSNTLLQRISLMKFVVHIRLDKMDELKLKYRHLDVLLIDDIQSLAKKFNASHSRGILQYFQCPSQ